MEVRSAKLFRSLTGAIVARCCSILPFFFFCRFRVRRALENTAKRLPGLETLVQGQGLVQVRDVIRSVCEFNGEGDCAEVKLSCGGRRLLCCSWQENVTLCTLIYVHAIGRTRIAAVMPIISISGADQPRQRIDLRSHSRPPSGPKNTVVNVVASQAESFNARGTFINNFVCSLPLLTVPPSFIPPPLPV